MRLRDGWRPGNASTLEEAVERIPLEIQAVDALGEEIASFVRSVRGGHEVVVTGSEGRAALALALRVTEAIQRSPALPVSP